MIKPRRSTVAPDMASRRQSWRLNPLYLVGAVLALALPWLLGLAPGVSVGYVLYLVSLALIYAIAALGLNLLIGYAGQFSLGHAGFMAIGAYTSAILALRLDWPFMLTLAASALVAGLVGFLLGLPALRLTGPYLAVVTLGFGLAIPQLIIYLGPLTGGSSGLHGLPRAAIGPLVFGSDREFYYVVLAAVVLLTWFARNVVDSYIGRGFIALRDSELAAQAMGVNLTRAKTAAFALSAAFTGIAGSLYAYLIHGIGPEDFSIFLSVSFLSMIVVGGLASIEGALLGAFLLTAMDNLLTRLPLVRDFKNLTIVVYGVVLILTILFLPHGLAGWLRRARTWRGLRPRSGEPAERSAAPDQPEPIR